MSHPNLPGPMRELLHRADELPNGALERIGAEMQRQPPSPETIALLRTWVYGSDVVTGWYQALSGHLGRSVEQRFGPSGGCPREDGHSPVQYIRPALEAACLALTMASAGDLQAAAIADACRAWRAARERQETTA